MNFAYNELIIVKWRKGTFDDPYIDLVDNKKIIKNITILQEIPDDMVRVSIIGYNEKPMDKYSLDGILTSTQFAVDYSNGWVFFNSTENAKTVRISYKGKGVILYPAERIYYAHEGDNSIIKTLQDLAALGEIAVSTPHMLDNLVAMTNIARTAIAEVETVINASNVEQVELTTAINLADTRKTELTTKITDATTAKANLDASITSSASITAELNNANTVKTNLTTATSNGQVMVDKINTAAAVQNDLDARITTGNTLKTDLDSKVSTANTAKENLDSSIANATNISAQVNAASALKTELDNTITTGNTLKTNLDSRFTTGNSLKTALDNSVASSNTAKTALDGSVVGGQNKIQEMNAKLVEAETTRQQLLSTDTAFKVLQPYSASNTYIPLNKVTYLGGTFQCILQTLDHLPTDTIYWICIAQAGVDNSVEITAARGTYATLKDRLDALIIESRLANLSISTRTIQDGSVTLAKLAPDAKANTTIADGSVTTIKLANLVVTEPKLAANSVSPRTIPNGSLTADKFAAGVLTTNTNAEVVAARGSFTTLKDRLDARDNSWVNVKWFGAKGDASQLQGETLPYGTDDSQAFKDAMQYIRNSRTRNTQYNDQVVRLGLLIPAGRYMINQPESMMLGSYGLPATSGLHIKGQNRDSTEIIYNPSTVGTYLFNNNNAYNFMTISDITFTSTGTHFNSLDHSFMRSKSIGQAQNIVFERVTWNGGWKEALKLVGDNNNSELSWFHCSFNGHFENAIHIPYDSANLPESGNDQMVNYNFFATDFVVTRGTFLNFQKGGSINIWGGNLMYYGSNTGRDINGTMFKLGNYGHANGTCRFLITGVRIELVDSNSIMMECEWNVGHVMFVNLDQSTQSYRPDSEINYPTSIFDVTNGSPQITHIGCSIQGKHRYIYNESASLYNMSSISYDSCEFMNHVEPDTFLIFENVSGFYYGGVPQVKFENCRGYEGKLLFDTVFNWRQNMRGTPVRRVLSLSNDEQNFPTSVFFDEFKLPIGAVIVKIVTIIAPNATTSTATGWQYILKNKEATPRVLQTSIPVSADNPKNGFNTITDNIYFVCNTDLKRSFQWTASAPVANGVKGMCFIEYYA